MKHKYQFLSTSLILLLLFLVFGFASVQESDQHQYPKEVLPSLQSLESQFILIKEMNDYFDSRIKNRSLTDYAQRLDARFMKLHRDFSRLIVQNEWDISYILLPEDDAFLQEVKMKSRFSNEQFLTLIISSLDRLEEEINHCPTSAKMKNLSSLIQEIDDTQQRWKTRAIEMQTLNNEVLASE